MILKYEVFHDMPVPFMWACVCLKPVLLGIQALLFLQNWHNDTWSELKKNKKFKKIKKTFCFAKNGQSGPKIVGFFLKKNFFIFFWK